MTENSPLTIVADENIPLVREAFATLGQVRTLPGRGITREAVREADMLLVRSITKVNEALLGDTRVKFVATATIGTDHVDQDWLAARGIGFASAPGSNSNSVAEYVTAALLFWAERNEIELAGKTLGVVGVGHVGSKVVAKAQALGMYVLCNDPPVRRAGGHDDYVDLDHLIRLADAVTFHVPLETGGEDPTFHLIEASLMDRLADGKPAALLINSSRGGVQDTASLLAAREARRAEDLRPVDLVLDVWENEPNIDLPLLDETILATPHIAGYSLDGKLAGTMMIYQAACAHFGRPAAWTLPADIPGPKFPVVEIETADLSDQDIARLAVRHAYDIEWDDAALRQIAEQPADKQGVYFDELRRRYPVRREFPAVAVRLAGDRPSAAAMLRGLGFRVRE
ncbi:MAG: 4-phosphoerythronate dehydrogenase [Phycisphaerae bacterium]|nr:4-phosphoerythronate dehydrogenase [Phycisphaerae bacterium]